MSLSAIGACDTPGIARPVKVRFKNACAATRIKSEPNSRSSGSEFCVIEWSPTPKRENQTGEAHVRR